MRERVRVGFAGGGECAAGRSRKSPTQAEFRWPLTQPLTLTHTLADICLEFPDESYLWEIPAYAHGEGTPSRVPLMTA